MQKWDWEREKERGNDTKTFGLCSAQWSQEQKDTRTHVNARTPCDLSISAIVTPSHSLWLFDHNLPPTPGLQSNRNFQKIMLARHEISDDLCWNNFDIPFFFFLTFGGNVWQTEQNWISLSIYIFPLFKKKKMFQSSYRHLKLAFQMTQNLKVVLKLTIALTITRLKENMIYEGYKTMM